MTPAQPFEPPNPTTPPKRAERNQPSKPPKRPPRGEPREVTKPPERAERSEPLKLTTRSEWPQSGGESREVKKPAERRKPIDTSKRPERTRRTEPTEVPKHGERAERDKPSESPKGPERAERLLETSKVAEQLESGERRELPKVAERRKPIDSSKRPERARRSEPTEATKHGDRAERTELVESSKGPERAERTELLETLKRPERPESGESREAPKVAERSESVESSRTREAVKRTSPREAPRDRERAERREPLETSKRSEPPEDGEREITTVLKLAGRREPRDAAERRGRTGYVEAREIRGSEQREAHGPKPRGLGPLARARLDAVIDIALARALSRTRNAADRSGSDVGRRRPTSNAADGWGASWGDDPGFDGSCAISGVHVRESPREAGYAHGRSKRGQAAARGAGHPHLRLVSSVDAAMPPTARISGPPRSGAPAARDTHAPRPAASGAVRGPETPAALRVTFVCRPRLIRKLAHASALLSDGCSDPPIESVVELAIDSLIGLIHDA